MNLVKRVLLLFVMLFMFSRMVYAQPSSSLSVNSGTIENGGSVTATVTIHDVASWQVMINCTGATNGNATSESNATQDGNNTTKTFYLTCKASSTGIINFTLSGTAASSDESKIKLSGNKQVTVTVPREKSKNNKLKSLSVEGYEITPSFSADVNEYTVSVPSTVDKITINASKADGYASLSGTGEKEVEEGVNTFEIVVTSETGVSNTYKLTVNVEDQNPIEVTVDGKKYTLVKVAKNLVKPELFDETTITISDTEIPAFVNEVSKYTLVGLKDENGNISLFIYKDGKYSLFSEFLSDSLSIIFLEPKKLPDYFVKSSIKINEKNIVAYKVKGESKYILYGLNLSNGKENYYTYDSSEKTLQKFDIKRYEKRIKDEENNKYMIYGLSGGVLFLLILLMLVSSKNKKLKKIINLERNILENKQSKVEEKEIEEDFEEITDKKKNKTKKEKKLEEPEEEEYNILKDKPRKKSKKK